MRSLIEKIVFSGIIITCSISAIAVQTDTINKYLPQVLTIDNERFILNGYGERKLFHMNIYISALYLISKNSNEDSIISGEAPCSIRLYIITNLPLKNILARTIMRRFKIVTNNNIKPIKPSIDQLSVHFKGNVVKGDIFDLTYTPLKGVTVYKNGEFKITIKNLDFKKALLSIWIGSKPATQKLKMEMLGLKL